jgi:signal peptidase II
MPVHPWMSVGLGLVMVWFIQDATFKIQNVPKILLISGIVWNMIDRILYGAVRDFLWIGDWFPVFNLADVYMCVGVGLMFWFEMNGWLKS